MASTDIEIIGSADHNPTEGADANNHGNVADRCAVVTAIGPILADPYGAPDLPSHIHGSISHKDNLGLAVAIIDDEGRVGCDVELCTNSAAGLLQNRILTQMERDSLGTTPSTSEDASGISDPALTLQQDIMLRFSFKESVFKAIHPFLARSVDFTEVQVFPTLSCTPKDAQAGELSGSAKIDFLLTGSDGEKMNVDTTHLDLQFSYEAYWCQHEEYFITAVYVRSNGIGDPTYKTKHHKLTQGQEV